MNFTGATSKTISGTSTTTFNDLTVNKGTSTRKRTRSDLGYRPGRRAV